VAFKDQSGVPVAIAVTATNSRMLPERRAVIAEVIRSKVEALGPLPLTAALSA
jgi:DNA-binding IclR family transcriptional regulator